MTPHFVFVGVAGHTLWRKSVSSGAVGATQAAVWAVHGPAALLQGHRAGWQLDEQARGTNLCRNHSSYVLKITLSLKHVTKFFKKILKVSICLPQGFPAKWRLRWLSGQCWSSSEETRRLWEIPQCPGRENHRKKSHSLMYNSRPGTIYFNLFILFFNFFNSVLKCTGPGWVCHQTDPEQSLRQGGCGHPQRCSKWRLAPWNVLHFTLASTFLLSIIADRSAESLVIL